MRLPNQRFPALRKRLDKPVGWLMAGLFSLPLIFLTGCSANGTSSVESVEDFFTGATPSPSPTPEPTATPTPTAVRSSPSPVAAETPKRPSRRAARQALAASENAAAAAKSAANASAEAAAASKQAATASKQAASVANQVAGTGPTSNDISLEANPGPTAAVAVATPAAATSLAGAAPTTAGAGTPTLSSPGLDSPGAASDADPAKAAKMIQDIDKIEKQVDRTNLSADDSQRDILAQKLLQQAKTALADRDSVAALSLATKASTLLEPLPKIADSVTSPAP
jgi:hypothetical protein